MSPSRSQPRRVLVTGGAGFIGSNIIDRLSALGHSVFAVDDMSSGRERNISSAIESGVRFEELDVRAPEFRSFVRSASADVVIHLAAQIDVRRSVRDPIEDASRARSEERRVGKECRSRWSPYQ